MSTPFGPAIPHNLAFDSEEQLFQHLEAYPWSTDQEFQDGLRAILGATPPPQAQEGSHQDELILQAKCFYYSRKTNKAIDFQAFKSWLRTKGSRSNPATNLPPTSFLPSIDATIEGDAVPAVPRMSPLKQHPQLASSDVEAQGETVESVKTTATTAAPPPAGPYPTSFAQIVELIESGKPIPGIEEIPDTVLAGQEGPSKEKRRMKPWEMIDVREGGVVKEGDFLGTKREA